ncbi:MAG: HAD family hydrolase [Gammaproteobacteria bacterium]|nr:HAD family hydrolase [Gammaproteobacteria bacterium]
MALTLFDLDNTLIADDSDYLWGQYLVDKGIVDPIEYAEKNRLFFDDYEQGKLDIDQYLKFSLKPLSLHSMENLNKWRIDYVDNVIRPLIAKGTPDLIKKHRSRGDTLMIISATNLFITQPIADLLGIPNILATRPEILNGRYTGNYTGTATFQEGKVKALNEWLMEQHIDLSGSTFYSDSHNDQSLLEKVDYPVAVNPDQILQQTAEKNNWPIIDLRN